LFFHIFYVKSIFLGAKLKHFEETTKKIELFFQKKHTESNAALPLPKRGMGRMTKIALKITYKYYKYSILWSLNTILKR